MAAWLQVIALDRDDTGSLMAFRCGARQVKWAYRLLHFLPIRLRLKGELRLINTEFHTGTFVFRVRENAHWPRSFRMRKLSMWAFCTFGQLDKGTLA